MSTLRQSKALDKMVENGGNVSKAMIEVGYSLNTARTPQKLTQSIGFIKLCEESGLTDELLIDALVQDIKTKKGHRKAELELGFKIKGRFVQKINLDDNRPVLVPLTEKQKEGLLSLISV